MPTVGSIQVADVLVALDAMGADTETLREQAGITRGMLDDPAARIPAGAAVRVFELAAVALDDPLVGLSVGLKLRPRGPLFFLLLAGPDTRHAIRAYARFAKLALDSIEVRFIERAEHAELTFDPVVPALRASHHLLDYCVTSNLAAMRGSIPDFEPIGVDLAHAEVGPAGGAARALGCPVRFERPVTAVHMPLAILDGRPFAANPLIAEQLAKMQQAILANLGTSGVSERVAAAIRRMLAAGVTPQRSDVARQLHVSERTLQRQLESEGTTFKSIRDEVRTELSRALLSDRSMKVEAIARSLGYAEVASFSKAFARWSGGPPSTFRSGAARPTARHAAVRPRNRG